MVSIDRLLNGAITKFKVLVCVKTGELPSVTVNTTGKVPATVGVPEITPVAGS